MKLELNKIHRKIGLVLIIGSLLMITNGAIYFLIVANFSVFNWLVFNICAPVTVVFIAGYFLNNKILLTFATPFLLFFGGGGLFVFGWQGTMIMAQIHHIIMMVMIVYAAYVVFKETKIKDGLIGLIAGIILLAVILPGHQQYQKDHPELVKQLGDQKFEEFVKNK